MVIKATVGKVAKQRTLKLKDKWMLGSQVHKLDAGKWEFRFWCPSIISKK